MGRVGTPNARRRGDAAPSVPITQFVVAVVRAHLLLLDACAETVRETGGRPDPITIVPRVLRTTSA